ncbi:hypothetical protein DFJ74DRAFT_518879 [Hyaloraphidium curvatum]|nr:hypothetical protein DFJ74DRAFT_518879 [Hyaloraphidium curvatum]
MCFVTWPGTRGSRTGGRRNGLSRVWGTGIPSDGPEAGRTAHPATPGTQTTANAGPLASKLSAGRCIGAGTSGLPADARRGGTLATVNLAPTRAEARACIADRGSAFGKRDQGPTKCPWTTSHPAVPNQTLPTACPNSANHAALGARAAYFPSRRAATRRRRRRGARGPRVAGLQAVLRRVRKGRVLRVRLPRRTRGPRRVRALLPGAAPLPPVRPGPGHPDHARRQERRRHLHVDHRQGRHDDADGVQRRQRAHDHHQGRRLGPGAAAPARVPPGVVEARHAHAVGGGACGVHDDARGLRHLFRDGHRGGDAHGHVHGAGDQRGGRPAGGSDGVHVHCHGEGGVHDGAGVTDGSPSAGWPWLAGGTVHGAGRIAPDCLCDAEHMLGVEPGLHVEESVRGFVPSRELGGSFRRIEQPEDLP